MNRAAIIDARFVRHGCEWRDLNFAPGECLDVQAKQMLDRLERETRTAAQQCVITTARFSEK